MASPRLDRGDRPGVDHLEITDEAGRLMIASITGPYAYGRARMIVASPEMRRALIAAERFVSGFEDDELQPEANTLLQQMGDAIAQSGDEQ
jgi:hypothetical protein